MIKIEDLKKNNIISQLIKWKFKNIKINITFLIRKKIDLRLLSHYLLITGELFYIHRDIKKIENAIIENKNSNSNNNITSSFISAI